MPSGRVVVLGGASVPAASQISVADARRFAPLATGRWKGGWRDTTGRSGTSDVAIAVNPMTLKATATVAIDGPILGGAALPTVTYDVDLRSYAKDAPAWTVQSPQLGAISATADGGVSLTAGCTQVPGHAEIASIAITGTRLGQRADGRYTISHHDGSTIVGTIAWTSGATRALPQDPANTADNSNADIMSGSYAASFATAAQLSAAMGRPTPAPAPNGGRLFYAPGIDVSNATTTTADGQLFIQYSVYRGHTAQQTATFWQQQLLGQPTVPGPWTAAFFQSPATPTLYAYTGSRLLLIQIGPTVAATGSPPPNASLQALCLAVAKIIVPQLNAR